MPQYHVGCGLAAIYAGIKSDSGGWKSKSAVTDEVIGAAAQFLLDTKQNVTFTKNGKRYRLSVSEIEEHNA